MSKIMKEPANGPNDKHFEVKCYARRSGDGKVDSSEESEDILIHDGVVYERMTDDFKIDLDSIPDHAREELAKATLEFVRNILRQPGGREFLDQKKVLRKQK